MSNDQTNPAEYLTPILLVVGPNTDQQTAAQTELGKRVGEIDPAKDSAQLQWINIEPGTITIEQIRQVINELSYASHLGKTRAFVLLHADNISAAGQHAFLKSLEEPPTKTLIMLVTSQPNKLLPTITSRCLMIKLANEKMDAIDLPKEIISFIADGQQNYTDLIKLAEEYKDRDNAQQLVAQLILWSVENRSQMSTKRYLAVQTQLSQTAKELAANVNSRLALEHCLFQLKV